MTLKSRAEIGALITSFAWLIYWTGRWYKEWYFAQFGISHDVLGFPTQYYFFGSWATVATAACLLLLLVVPLALAWCRLLWPYMVPAFVLSTAAAALQVWHPSFNSEGGFWRKILGSGDIVVMLCGLLEFGLFILVLIRNEKATESLQRVRARVTLPWGVTWAAIVLLSWAYLAGMGYLMGTYHGQAAIWEGKMNTRWVKHASSWWIFVVRPEADRNFIFDRDACKTKVVNDAEIEEWGGPVTRKPR